MKAQQSLISHIDTEQSVRQRTELFERLIFPNRNLVYKICMRFTSRWQDVEENYNECLANLYRYVHTYDPGKKLANWIFICCKRLIYDLDRRRAAFKTSDDLDPEHIISHHAEDTDRMSGNCMGLDNNRELYSDDILRALDRLNPRYRIQARRDHGNNTPQRHAPYTEYRDGQEPSVPRQTEDAPNDRPRWKQPQ